MTRATCTIRLREFERVELLAPGQRAALAFVVTPEDYDILYDFFTNIAWIRVHKKKQEFDRRRHEGSARRSEHGGHGVVVAERGKDLLAHVARHGVVARIGPEIKHDLQITVQAFRISVVQTRMKR